MLIAPVSSASAQNFFELLFGGFRRAATSAQAYADPNVVSETGDRQGGERGERGAYASYCVRLCDGQHFPVTRAAGVTAAQACSSFCPAATTKVFSGGGIDHAVASDGARYADLANAFVYRQKLVPNCTCNGATPGGLASLDVNADPTLRPGDIVATNDGFEAFSSTKKGTAEFTPLSAEARRKLADVKVRPAPARAALQANAKAPPEQPSLPTRSQAKRAQLAR
jgi:hypothetical protein